jgi:hypothetical protein
VGEPTGQQIRAALNAPDPDAHGRRRRWTVEDWMRAEAGTLSPL